MVANWPLFILDLVSFCVYLDLLLVNYKKIHIFTPILKYLPKSATKPIQKYYQSSLTRLYFCVLDKVRKNGKYDLFLQIDVQNTNFALIFNLLSFLSILLNLFMIHITVWHFYIVAIPSLFYLMSCMHLYKALRELCFYCKYSIVSQILWIGIYSITVREIPSSIKWVAAIGLVGSLFVRGLARKERAKQRKMANKSKREEEEQEMLFE